MVSAGMSDESLGKFGPTVQVVFCADEGVLEPLQSAVASLVEHTSCDLVIWLGREIGHASLVTRVSPVIDAALGANAKNPRIEVMDLPLDLRPFKALNGLHGNWMTYGRLLIPNALRDARQCVYLDADLVVRGDIREIAESDLGESPVAGIPHTTLATTLEQEVWRRHSLDLGSPYFNAGVLVMNLEAMRSDSTLERCLEFMSGVQDCVSMHDQTALNVVCHGRWKQLDPAWNHAAWPGDSVVAANEAKIVHYIGSPKPWDVGGKWINPQGVFYQEVHDRYAEVIQMPRGIAVQVRRWKRAVRLARSYWGAFRKRFK